MHAAAQVAPPVPDADSAFYWAGLRDHKLLVQQCGACSRFRFPPMPSCPYCASMQSGVHSAKGTGTVYTYVVGSDPFLPAFKHMLPHVMVVTELDEGPRLVGYMVNCTPAEMKIGMKVRVVFRPLTERVTLPVWEPLR